MANLAFSLIMLIFLIGMAQGRLIRLSTSNELVSDGLNDDDNHPSSPFLGLNGLSRSSSSAACTHEYGFLPCADNIKGYVFQLFFYQYLMYVGGQFVSSGSTKLFTLLGTGVYGGSVFPVLSTLPRIIFVIMSGVFSSKEGAQQQVSLGLSIYAGSTALSLTLLWGFCVIYGSKAIWQHSSRSKDSSSSPADTNTKAKEETRDTARIMLLSLVPYAILLPMNIFSTSSANRVVILIALIVSTMLLLAYFWYKIDSGIQQKSSENDQQKRSGDEQTTAVDQKTNSLNQKIRRHCGITQQRSLSYHQSLMVEELQDQIHEVKRNYALSKMIKKLDINKDGKITEKEFNEGCNIWLNEPKPILDVGDSMAREFLEHVAKCKSEQHGEDIYIKRVKERMFDGKKVDIHFLIRLFNEYSNDSNYISRADQSIEDRFYIAVKKLLDESEKKPNKSDDKKSVEIHFRRKLLWVTSTYVAEIILGVGMLTFLAKPLVGSILQISDAMGLSTFFISFIIVPLITNGKKAISTIKSVRLQRENTASILSEIYGDVIMNNVMGLTTLLAIVYAKELTWNYSAEVLIIFLICAVVGFVEFRDTTHPLWTGFFAFFMYLFSLALFYVLKYFLGWN